MPLLQVNRHPSVKQLWTFASAWCVLWAALAGLGAVRGRGPATVGLCVLAAVAVPLAGWAHRPLLRLVYVALCYAALPLGWLVSHALLALVYFGLITPLGLVLRLVRPDPLRRRLERDAESYWIRRAAPRDPGEYVRQY